ncbi:MAG: bifunctional DNA primase/polymerase [Deltaproteobacteria bacterium]|nr:bifunctional DNA primase/polymerase [Deltaproteobacteria bacterium]
MKKTDTLSIAKGYRKAGFSVIPLLPKSKKPAIQWHEFQKRLPSDEELEAWFGNGSHYNIGIVTGAISGLAVLDADSAGAVTWCEASLPKTPAVKTARGRHYYFRFRDGLKNSVRVNGLKLDVRGQGGYVAAPCSVHESGAVYHWVEDRGLDDLSLSEFPAHLLIGKNEKASSNREAKTGNKYGQAALASELAKLCAATEGERNDTLNRAAFALGSLVAGGELDRRQVETSLLSTAISIGLTESEASTTIKSGMDAGAMEPRTAPRKDGATGQASITSVAETKDVHIEPVPLPDELSPVADFDFSLLPDAVRPWA